MAIDRIKVPNKIEIIKLQNGSFPCYSSINYDQCANIVFEIAKHIKNGVTIPNYFYRISTGKDYLLEELGWLHLHLYAGSDELLIVKQTDHGVIFIGLADHTIFQKPLGSKFLGLKDKIAKAEMKLKADKIKNLKEQLLDGRISMLDFTNEELLEIIMS